MITAEEFELAEAALQISADVDAAAMRLLRDECGWSSGRALMVIRSVRVLRERLQPTKEQS